MPTTSRTNRCKLLSKIGAEQGKKRQEIRIFILWLEDTMKSISISSIACSILSRVECCNELVHVGYRYTFWHRYDVPLVADIHFQPQVAMMVADAFEKIRINPGNFADGRKTFEVINYDDPAQFRAEQEHIREAS